MGRSVVVLPPSVGENIEVYLNGVRQEPDTDFHRERDTLVFERMLRKDRIAGWRWFLGAWGVGTYRQEGVVEGDTPCARASRSPSGQRRLTAPAPTTRRTTLRRFSRGTASAARATQSVGVTHWLRTAIALLMHGNGARSLQLVPQLLPRANEVRSVSVDRSRPLVDTDGLAADFTMDRLHSDTLEPLPTPP